MIRRAWPATKEQRQEREAYRTLYGREHPFVARYRAIGYTEAVKTPKRVPLGFAVAAVIVIGFTYGHWPKSPAASGTPAVSNGPISGPWSASDQGTFAGWCAAGQSDGYCRCALRIEMALYPDPAVMPMSVKDVGLWAAGHTLAYPGCTP